MLCEQGLQTSVKFSVLTCTHFIRNKNILRTLRSNNFSLPRELWSFISFLGLMLRGKYVVDFSAHNITLEVISHFPSS